MKKIFVMFICILLLSGCSNFNDTVDDGIQITSSEQLHGRKIGINTGSIYENYIKEHFPDSKYVYFNSRPELILALKANKISAFMLDDFTAIQYAKENDFLTILDEKTMTIDNGFIFSDKASNVLNEFNEYLRLCTNNGYLKYLKDKWVNNLTDDTRISNINFTGEKGVLNAITSTDGIPMAYMADGQYQGYETELFYSFCSYAGYTPNIQSADFGALITAISSGKYDVSFASISITEDRKKNVTFSNPVYSSQSVIVVFNQDAVIQDAIKDEPVSNGSFGNIFDSFKSKINLMFIEEDRWLFILNGIKVTVIITILSLLIGTIIGFVLYLFCSNTVFLKRLFSRISFIINRIPVLLILMFMFYIVFSESSIDGVYISVIAFSIIEIFSVYSMLNTGIDAIDKGQTEAGLALGYTKNQTLFKYVLPQALKIIMPSYKNDVVSLIKATSVVGYITVQDLTRVSDIIRSRTYEAFFPLVVSAIIYFILAWLLSWIVEQLQKRFLPNDKSKEEILNKYK